METKYIIVIICSALFVLLLLTYITVYVLRRKKEEQKRRELEQMYSDKNLVKMEYDCAVYDEETEKIISSQHLADDQMTIEDVMKSEAAFEGSVFQTVDKEGLEEITGNYNPDKK